MKKRKVFVSLTVRFPERTREAGEPYGRGQWDSALKAAPHSPKGDVSYVGALEPTVRSGAHGFRSRRPRSLLIPNLVCPSTALRTGFESSREPSFSHFRNVKRKIQISLAGVLISLLFLRAVDAQLIPLNFVYTGSGGQSDALKFTYEQGFFKKHGLNVTMLYVTSGVITSQTITSGAVQVATTTATDALGAMAAGSPMKIVMVNIDQFQHVFVARPEIKSHKDMKGKKIAVSRYGAFSDIQTRFLVRQWGMDPEKDVQILQIGNSAARSAALASGGVDGAIVSPAFVPVAKKIGLNVIFDLATIKGKFASQIMVAHDQFIKERPEVLKLVVAGFLDGIRQWKTQPEAAKAYLRKHYKVSEADIENIYAETSKFLRSEPTPDLEGIQNAWESIPHMKGRGGNVDFGKFVDASFVREGLQKMK